MKVEEAPITILSEPTRSRITIVTGGIRIAMSGDEASSFWTHLGNALKTIHAKHPERCPPNLMPPPQHDRADADASASDERPERALAYARRLAAQPNGTAGSFSTDANPNLQPQTAPSSVLGRALGKLTGR